ncbi:unnamed protein product [Amoebophrya sp. A120]|nr:unnamed protein product [Amoebophrya sp. A120]|eukprot:GSA120T00012624001.1
MVRTNVRRTVKGDELKPFEAIAEEFKKAYSIWVKTRKQRGKLEKNPESQMVKNLYANEHMALFALLDSLSSLVVNYNMRLDEHVGQNADKYTEMVTWVQQEMDDVVTQGSLLEAEANLNKEQIVYNLLKYLDLNRQTKVVAKQMAALDAIAKVADDGTEKTKPAEMIVEKFDLNAEKDAAIAVPQDTTVVNTEAGNVRKTVAIGDANAVGTQRLSATMPTHDGLGAAWDENVKPLTDHEDKATERVVFQDMLAIVSPDNKKLSASETELIRLNMQEALCAKQTRLLTRGGCTVIEVADSIERVTPLQMRDAMLTASWPYDTVPVTRVRDANCPRFYCNLPRNLDNKEVQALKDKLQASFDCLDIRADMAPEDPAKKNTLAVTAIEPVGKLDMAKIEAALKSALPKDCEPKDITRGQSVERYLATLAECPARHSQELMLMRNKLKQNLGCKEARVVPRSGRLNVEVIQPHRGSPTAEQVKAILEEVTPVQGVKYGEAVVFAQQAAGDAVAQPLAQGEVDALQKAITALQGPNRTLKLSQADGWQVADVTYGSGAKDADREGILDLIDAGMEKIGKKGGDAYSTFSTPEDKPTRKSRATNFNFAPDSRRTDGAARNAHGVEMPRETRGDGPQNFDKLIADEHNLQGRISIALPVYGFEQNVLGPNAMIDGANLFAKDETVKDGCVAVGSQYAFDNGGYYAEAKVIKTAGTDPTGFIGLGFSTVPLEKYGEKLGARLADLGQNWVCTGPYPGEETHTLLCNGKLNLRFVYAHAQKKEQQTMNWQVGDTLGVWVRRRDGKAKEWLLSVFINKNRIYTCNCNIPDGIDHFRIVCECGGRVKGIKLLTDAHPPARLALNYWYNPLKKGAQRIIENILFVDESCAKKHPLKVDWTMSMSPCNISHTETKKCKILTWSNQTLATPLTRLPDLDKSLALKCSKMILVLMANRVLEQGKEPTSDERAKIAYTLFWYFKHRQCLRDEILLFVIKQLTQNPERKSTLFGYVLLQILMEGAIEANYHLPILLDDFLNNQESTDPKILGEITKTRKLFRDIHDKFANQFLADDDE